MEGAVTRQDFLDPRPPRCLRRITNRRGLTGVVYPWTEPEHHGAPRANNRNERVILSGTNLYPGRSPWPAAATSPGRPVAIPADPQGARRPGTPRNRR